MPLCNRHCPKCQGLARVQWLEERRAELLPVGYFQNVFTLPHELNDLAAANPRRLNRARAVVRFGIRAAVSAGKDYIVGQGGPPWTRTDAS